MAGLVPAIHVLAAAPKTWMPATSAVMTVNNKTRRRYDFFTA
jgi:hypothetical protein